MDDTSGDKYYEPGEVAKRLFFTNADGESTDPDTAIAVALDGDWEQLEPEAAALLADEEAGAYGRYLALSALCRWASPIGYAGVRDAAQDPDAQPWRDMSIDRFYSLDNTFAMLAQSVVGSVEEAGERGSTAERFAALAALIGIADRVYFEHNLSPSGLYNEDVVQLRGLIEAAIEHGLAKLATAEVFLPGFVSDQVEELINALGLVDKGAADAYRARLGD
ncbi:hypothetical protein VE00_02886 [Pseudogymnoascus sp. WSF 3629]|nr:hypothetical protein VE00_02886 [Pseudogymnoascus sp. WSF 3629]